MALWLPGNTASQFQSNGGSAATTISTTVTGSGTANTKGSWAQLVASTDFEVTELTLWITIAVFASATDTSTLLDIGIGAAASETVLIPNINFGHAGVERTWRFPIRIPAGSRLSARVQSAVTSKVVTLTAFMIGTGGWDRSIPGRRAVTYGANTADSSGVLLDDPTTNHTEGAWTEITSSTSQPMRWLIPQFSGKQGDTNWTATSTLVDIAVGASSSEQAIITNFPVTMSSSEQMVYPSLVMPVSIPTGTRLSARIQQAAAASGTPIEATITGLD